ncbi:Hsp70 family protein [Rhodovulum sp. DZ06]|uniref:Hsp70 family protein n=1 Tax=Rhodovulum sp. DZ06 TaxID=3425126 RepID=UPI003D329F91
MIIGIDLGTTNSVCAVFKDGEPALVPNALGETVTPSAVHLGKDGAMTVGRAARDRLATEPDRTAARFKRWMGTQHDVRLGRRTLRPEDLSAAVLGALKADAEAFLGAPVTEAVISVPAYFNDVQRKATIAAAGIAGLTVRRLVNEPTAAALAYGVRDKEGESTFIVIDLGGGTFDVTVLEMFEGVMEVRASAGDAFLGGEDFTDALARAFAERIGADPGKTPPEDRARLRAAAETVKRRLAAAPEAEATVVLNGAEHSLTMDREGFAGLCEPLLARLSLPIRRALTDAQLRADDIDRIFLVGGATRLDAVRRMVSRLFGRFPEHEIDPDLAVGLGAAVQAGLLARDESLEEVVMTDVCPFTLGIASVQQIGEERYRDGVFAPIIERNTPIPASRAQTFQALRPGMKEVTISVYQGEAPDVKDNVAIGAYQAKIPSGSGVKEEIEVRFTYDVSGVLEVLTTASDGRETQLVIQNSAAALSEADIAQRLKELERIKRHPRDDAPNQAMSARLRAAYENALGDRRQAISGLIGRFEAALERQDPKLAAAEREEIAALLDRLGDGYDPF